MQVTLTKVGHDYTNTFGEKVSPLKEINLDVHSGDSVTILGPSGSGKSTLLFILGCMLKPSRGEVMIDHVEVSGLEDRELAQLRLQKIGFVLQQNVLQPRLTVWENMMLPFWIGGAKGFNRKEADQKVKGLLEASGLMERANFLPHQLSGGQRRRAAIVRALVRDPELILADEPTAELDETNQAIISQWLMSLAAQGKTVVIATHDLCLAGLTRQVYNLDNGCLHVRGERWNQNE